MELSETRDNKVRKYSNLRFEGYASFSSSSSSFYVRDAKSSPLRAKKFPTPTLFSGMPMQTISQLFSPDR